MTSSAQLERETEQTRARVTETLEELRTRLTPGQVFDQVLDYARTSGSGEFLRNLGRQTVANPLPVALIGAGLAWLMVAGTRNGSVPARTGGGVGSHLDRMADKAQGVGARWADTAERVGDRLGDGAERTGDRVGAAAERLGQAAGSTVERAGQWSETAGAIGEKMSSAYQAAADRASRSAAAVGDQAANLGGSLAEMSRNFAVFCREQPLVLAGLGLAVGAAIGALMPMTEAENRAMGEASDEVKRQAQALAQEQFERTKRAATEAYETARQATADHGEQHEPHEKPNEHNPPVSAAAREVGASEPTRGDNVPV